MIPSTPGRPKAVQGLVIFKKLFSFRHCSRKPEARICWFFLHKVKATKMNKYFLKNHIICMFLVTFSSISSKLLSSVSKLAVRLSLSSLVLYSVIHVKWRYWRLKKDDQVTMLPKLGGERGGYLIQAMPERKRLDLQYMLWNCGTM